MDVLLKRSLVAEDEKEIEFAGDLMASTAGNLIKEYRTYKSDRSSDTAPLPSSPITKDLTSQNQDEQLESARAEMSEVRQENERLKTVLARILKDYQDLQMQFLEVVKHESSEAKTDGSTPFVPHPMAEEDRDLVSLTLGSSMAMLQGIPKKEEKMNASANKNEVKEDEHMGGGLTLALDCKFEGSSSASTQPTTNISLENSSEDQKEEDGGEQWPPNKLLKTAVEDEVSQQIQIKKARVSVRTRCDGPTMNDGCQWRKYGQKISKGNPCPRAYYRCTVAPGCPVRKQVQRCSEDMSILITTYEGTHSHPLPMAATAMASTTSAAASMLLSGSSSSRSSVLPSPFATTMTSTFNTPSSTLQGLNFSLPDTSRPKPYFLPSTPSITTTPSHPTITLDLTSQSPSATTSAPTAIPSTQFNRFSSPFASSISRYPTSLSFSSASDVSSMQSPWSQLYNNNTNKSHIGSLYQSPFLLKNSNNAIAATPQTQQVLTDSLAKAITSDPSFKSALAAAITSIVGGQGSQSGGGSFSGISSLSSTSSFANRPAQNQGSSVFLHPSMALPNSMSSSSNAEKRDHINRDIQ